ncbi:MAG: DNA repair protein RecN, partial [Pseudomonadota bacterium]
MDFLSFQVREFDALALEDGELAALEEEQQRAAHQERLHTGAHEALQLAAEREHDDAVALAGRAARALAGLADIDSRLTEPLGLLESASINLSEAADQLRHYLDDLDVDPERGSWVENRIGNAHALARKHRIEPAELTACAERLRAELATLRDADANIAALEARIDEAASAYADKAAALSRKRRRAAKKLTADVTAALQELGLAGGRFDVEVTPAKGASPSPDGQDTVRFLVSANPGQPPGPITKVASGGELSRISLGLEVVAAAAITVPCLVFDEVDTGVGGGVAEIVGQRLRALGARRQVLCVTHLPQV